MTLFGFSNVVPFPSRLILFLLILFYCRTFAWLVFGPHYQGFDILLTGQHMLPISHGLSLFEHISTT